MKIIAGKHKNRIIPTIKKADYRPTTSKFREALFSIITSGEFFDSQPLIGAKILDVFAGSGSLSFEAISRGANSASLIDINANYLAHASDFAKKIGELENIDTICSDALQLRESYKQFDIIFLDPPYFKNLGHKAISRLIKYNWLNNGALIAIELAKREKIDDLDRLKLMKEKLYGNNKLLLFKFDKNEEK